jgi:serine/threonine-protein kinase PpkA
MGPQGQARGGAIARWRALDQAMHAAGGGVVAGFRLEALIGRGRGSMVHRACPPAGEAVALKLARRAALARMGRPPDFGAECERARALRHPHVLRVLDHGIAGDHAFLAMEHCAGGDLARHPPRPDDVGAVVLQAAEALAHLHAQGWVHRDVKPANLLRRADGSIALGDFGSAARQGERPAMPGIAIGSPRYAAPEQTQGAPAAAAADVYGLGLALYEWLCGRPAHPGETPSELLGQHLLAEVPPLPTAHAAWQPLLDRLLAKDARGRPADGAAVLRELHRNRS